MQKKYEMMPIPSFFSRSPEKRTAPTAMAKEDAYALAEQMAHRDLLRTALFKQALDNTAILSQIVAHYLETAPTGAEEYRIIKRAYALSALDSILNGGI